MAERKPIPKGTRFEVLKRDEFTCQYCGREAPDVILEIDHIIPVSKGGDNSVMNLITSCRDCNRGKSDKELSDDSTVVRQKRQLDDIQDRREQLEMIIAWRKELMEEIDSEVDYIDSIYFQYTEWCMSESARRETRNRIKKYGFNEVCEATEISVGKYYDGSQRSWNLAFNKVGGICYNRKKKREEDAKQDN